VNIISLKYMFWEKLVASEKISDQFAKPFAQGLAIVATNAYEMLW